MLGRLFSTSTQAIFYNYKEKPVRTHQFAVARQLLCSWELPKHEVYITAG